MSMFPAPDCIWNLKAGLGEGPVWSEAERALYFVDIVGCRIHRFRPGGGVDEQTSWVAPARVTFIVPVEGGGFLCGCEDGLRMFDPATGSFGALHQVEADLGENRLNDGYVDDAGRLWFGTMHDPEHAETGALYRLQGYGDHPVPVLMDHGYTVSNGPTLDPVLRRIYHSDSSKQRIYAFDLDANGALGPRHVFAQIEHGYPDGMAVDVEGTLWVALYAGGGITRFRPDGSSNGTISMPCDNVTKIVFGDDDRRTAYVTTARRGVAEDVLATQPLAGGLFRFRVDVPGHAQNLFRA